MLDSDNLQVGQNWEELVQERNVYWEIVNSANINQKHLRQKEAANRQLSISVMFLWKWVTQE